MQWKTVRDHWPAYIPRILTRWPDLDEDEVQSVSGDRAGLTALLARAGDVDTDDAAADIEDWLAGSEPIDAVMDQSRDNEGILKSANHIREGEDVYSDDRDFGDDMQADRPMGRD